MADKLHFFVGNCSVQPLRIQARNKERGEEQMPSLGSGVSHAPAAWLWAAGPLLITPHPTFTASK